VIPQRWCFLIHTIPPRPPYLRLKIGRRLEQIGAIALKNSVYVLPHSDEAVEDFQWISEEIRAGGGDAFIVAGEVLAGITGHQLIKDFNDVRARDYELLKADARNAGVPDKPVAAAVARLRARLDEIRAIDFFRAPAGKEIGAMIERIEKQIAKQTRKPQRIVRPKGKTWVTRRGIKIDRIASAWLVRRFVDPTARFRFVDLDDWKKSEGEISFDMPGGDYTHEGDHCTFETIASRLGVKDRGVKQLAEIIHDIDMKDAKYDRAEKAGVQQVIEGLLAAHPRDEDRMERGFALFDDLHRSFKR